MEITVINFVRLEIAKSDQSQFFKNKQQLQVHIDFFTQGAPSIGPHQCLILSWATLQHLGT